MYNNLGRILALFKSEKGRKEKDSCVYRSYRLKRFDVIS